MGSNTDPQYTPHSRLILMWTWTYYFSIIWIELAYNDRASTTLTIGFILCDTVKKRFYS